MNESLDLRNRILKMRESNNLVLEQVKAETKSLNSNSKPVDKNIQNNFNIEKENLTDNQAKINTGIQKENSRNSLQNEKKVDSNLFAKKPVNSNIRYRENKEILNNLANDNEAQFRIIANKFNEAVEVILELSEKVKKLEGIVNNLPLNYVKDNKRQSFYNIKTYAYIILTILFIIGMLTFPIDISVVKLIIMDIISSI